MPDPTDPGRPHAGDTRRLDAVTLAALGEPVDADLAVHLRNCPECAAEVDALRHTVALAREGGPAPVADDVRPPAAVWDAIAGEVGLAADVPRAAAEVPSGPPPREVGRARPSRRWWFAAAAAVVVAAAAIGGFLVGREGSATGDCPTITAQLSAVGDASGSAVDGTAEVVCSADGPALRVTTDDLPIGAGFYEVWMYAPDSGEMVPVGALGGDGTGTFTLPGGMDVRDYPVVDVSAQHYDNDPSHGTSVLQGPLTR